MLSLPDLDLLGKVNLQMQRLYYLKGRPDESPFIASVNRVEKHLFDNFAHESLLLSITKTRMNSMIARRRREARLGDSTNALFCSISPRIGQFQLAPCSQTRRPPSQVPERPFRESFPTHRWSQCQGVQNQLLELRRECNNHRIQFELSLNVLNEKSEGLRSLLCSRSQSDGA
jgi:hypothetical protein